MSVLLIAAGLVLVILGIACAANVRGIANGVVAFNRAQSRGLAGGAETPFQARFVGLALALIGVLLVAGGIAG